MRAPSAARYVVLAALVPLGGLAACQRGGDAQPTPGSSASGGDVASASSSAPALESGAGFGRNSVAEAMPSGRPLIGASKFATTVYAEPSDRARKLGYLRVGAKVPRSEEPAATTKACPQGWYEIAPRGFVCNGEDATTNLDDPLLAAASRRPDLRAALPYRYAFVRAVLPLYLKLPNDAEQHKSEFKLDEHLAWYAENKGVVDKVGLGAWDVPLDDRGVPIAGKELGELGDRKTSLEVGLGVLFGGTGDDDPVPRWLEGGKRAIPNISEFDVPDYAVFADRARRFTGLALVGSFQAGPEALGRRFAVTSDLRLAPTTKLKPDTGSPWHGVEVDDPSALPFAFVREQGAVRWDVRGDAAVRGDELGHRARVKLTGKQKKVAGERYLATVDGGWLRASDVGVVLAPRAFPKVAERGEKWVEVSLSQQTLTLWEGTRPVYATLVSTGRENYATPLGEFRISNKHITATMDSDEGSDVAGGATASRSASSDAADPKPAKPAAKSSKASKPGDKKSPKPTNGKPGASKPGASKPGTSKPGTSKPGASKPAEKAASLPAEKIPTKGDGEYGVTRRRGEGTYKLRDVPYIQYFAAGVALHAAYWHDVFGKERSHGCVNLSPIDAHRVFMWTEPAIPEGWHGLNTGDGFGEGTTVIVHE